VTDFNKVVIDGDQMVYAAGFVTESDPLSHACQIVKKGLEKILRDCGTENYELYIGGEGNFREEVAITKGYKANRTKARPVHYDGIREYMQSVWDAEVVHGMEVDDKVSILLFEDFVANGEEGTLVLSSPDKDLMNTPGWHYNPRTRKIRFINETQASRHFWFQMLTGDTVDNIPGLPHGTDELITNYSLSGHCLRGMGETNAKRLMAHGKTVLDAERLVTEAYVSWGVANDLAADEIHEYMQEQGQLLWMIREEYEGFPVMWEADLDAIELLRGDYAP